MDAIDRELAEIIEDEGLPPTVDVAETLDVINRSYEAIDAALARCGLSHLIIE